MVSSPSEITPLTATFSCWSSSFTSVSKAVRSPWVLLSKGRANRISSERQSRITQSTSCPTSGRPPVNGQDHVSLLPQAGLDPLVIGDAQSHQFFIALHQRGHTALCNADATRQEGLMHFGHAAVFVKAPHPDQCHHLQAKLAVRQRPASFLLWSVGLMEARTSRLDPTSAPRGSTSTDHPSRSRCDARDWLPITTGHTLHSAPVGGP